MRKDMPKRQRQVLALLSDGKSNREIGLMLGIALHTVESHIQRLRERLGIRDRVTLARWWDRQKAEPVEFISASDPVVVEVQMKLRDRSLKGLEKYGVGLDRDDLSTEEWLNHLQEELLDAALYVQTLIRRA